MSITTLTPIDLTGTLLGFILTLFIFSYLLGDNALFRLAIHIFIGVAAGYVAVITWYNVIWSRLLLPIVERDGSNTNLLISLIPILLSLLLLFKLLPRYNALGSPVMAFLVGVGVATAIGGGIIGTLIPQTLATINMFDTRTFSHSGNLFWLLTIESLFILIGTLSVLIFFHFSAHPVDDKPPQRAAWIEGIASVGKIFIAITFGALFASILVAALFALVERWNFILMTLLSLLRL